MIWRFRIVVPGKLYRGSAPSPKDIMWLKDQLGIRKIVSLDKDAGDRISRACKLLGIHQVKMYVEDNRKDLLRLLSQDFKKLFLEDGPTFVHCHEGKDRTGLVSAIVECKYLGVTPEKAIEEAKSLGFGVGVPESMTRLYEKIIRSCKPTKDQNSADIVSNERTYVGDNRDSFLDEVHRGDFAPFLDHTKQAPMDALYHYVDEQSPTRENYQDFEALKQEHDFSERNVAPQVGIFNNDSGIYGMGPVINPGGFIYD